MGRSGAGRCVAATPLGNSVRAVNFERFLSATVLRYKNYLPSFSTIAQHPKRPRLTEEQALDYMCASWKQLASDGHYYPAATLCASTLLRSHEVKSLAAFRQACRRFSETQAMVLRFWLGEYR